MYALLAVRLLGIGLVLMQPSAKSRPLEAPCDPNLKKLAEGLPNGYRERDDNPDPCCEGQFKEKVGGHIAPTITLLEYSFGPRASKLDADTKWQVSWPSIDRGVLIRGRHRELATYYQVDAEKSKSGSVRDVQGGKFVWSGTKAAKLAFKPEEMLFSVRIHGLAAKSKDAPISDRLPEDSNIFLPAQIQLVPDPANKTAPSTEPDVGHLPSDRLPTAASNSRSLRVNLVANKSLSGVRFTAVREYGKPDDEPVVIARSTRNLDTTARLIRFDDFPFDGGVIRLDVYYVQGGVERKLEPIYLQLPDDTRDGVADKARSPSQPEVR